MLSRAIVAADEKHSVEYSSSNSADMLQGYPASKQDCKSMYSLLWNLGTQHFLGKDYPACVGAYTAALPYADADAKPRVGRQLALAHLALHQLDRLADTTAGQPLHDSLVKQRPSCMSALITPRSGNTAMCIAFEHRSGCV